MSDITMNRCDPPSAPVTTPASSRPTRLWCSRAASTPSSLSSWGDVHRARVEELHGDRSVQDLVGGAVDHRHPALSDGALDAVPAVEERRASSSSCPMRSSSSVSAGNDASSHPGGRTVRRATFGGPNASAGTPSDHRPAGSVVGMHTHGETAWEDRVAALWDDTAVGDENGSPACATSPRSHRTRRSVAFELGGAFDSGGREADAHERYAAATAAGLATVDPDRAARMVVQHASTLRNLGRVDEAIAMLRDAPNHPSTGAASRVFLALALHSAGRVDEALRVAIEAVEPTLPRYNRSVRAYAAALTDTRSR